MENLRLDWDDLRWPSRWLAGSWHLRGSWAASFRRAHLAENALEGTVVIEDHVARVDLTRARQARGFTLVRLRPMANGSHRETYSDFSGNQSRQAMTQKNKSGEVLIVLYRAIQVPRSIEFRLFG